MTYKLLVLLGTTKCVRHAVSPACHSLHEITSSISWGALTQKIKKAFPGQHPHGNLTCMYQRR